MILKTVAKNAGWLGLIQALNYVAPVVTVPVVARAFGPDVYGILATFYAYGAYIALATEYGFPTIGPRAIAGAHVNTQFLSQTVSTIVSAQFVLGATALVIFGAAMSIAPYGGDYKIVAVMVSVQTFATSMAPQWVFVGLEQTRNFALVQTVFRVAAAALVLLVIRTPGDLLLFAGINCVAAVLILVFSLLAMARFDIRWRPPSLKELIEVIRQASRLFVSSVSISFYTTANVLIVAHVLGPIAAGAFALADRLRLATAGVIGPMIQAIYPFVCRVAGREATHEEEWAKRVFFRCIVAMSALISLTLFAFAPFIIWLAGGEKFAAAIPVLRMIAFLPVIIALSTTFGMQTLLPLHMDRQYTWVVSSAAVLGVTGLFALTYAGGLPGAALTMLVVESYVAVAFAALVQRRMSVLSLFFKRP
ncbi:MAG: oligosaccharide flippase family protein [Methylocystis sp.]|nr:oligosaccharide flippase family protein [Methylocystis sp.]